MCSRKARNNDWLQDQTRVHLRRSSWPSARCCSSGASSPPRSRSSTCSAFSNVNFAFGSLFSFVIGIGLYGLTYLYPVFLGRIRGYDSLMIGETLFVSGLAMFFTAPITGILSRKMDLRLMMMIGFFGFAAGTWWMTHLTADWDFYELLIPQILRGCSTDAVHGADQQHRARHAAARPAEERVRPVQPDPQSRRRRRPGASSTPC